MKKSIRVMLAGLLAIPIIALGVTASTGNVFAGAAADGAVAAQGTGTKTELFGTGSLFNIISNTALFIIGALSVLMLIWGGIRYTTSAGDSSNITAAKNTILYAVVGIIVALLSYAIVNFVITKLG